MSTAPEQVARECLQRLEHAWNTADGLAFAAPFTEDADVVAIRGDHHRTGRRSRTDTRRSSIPSTGAAPSAMN